MKLDRIFSDGAVFAAGRPVRVFGTGEGTAAVSFLGREASSQSREGVWEVELPPSEPGGPYEMKVTMNGETVTLRDVYVGRVYLVAGQSNAELPLHETNTPSREYEDDPLLRNFFVGRPWNPEDPLSPDHGWYPARADEVKDWSAIGFLSGRRVRRAVGGAVGVISCFQGASVIESWLKRADAERFALPPEDLYEDHTLDLFAAFNQPSLIRERMLDTVIRYPVNGVIWYQGESDSTVPEANIYADELAAFVASVREDTGDADLPFVIIQIADADYRKTFDPEGWNGIQRAQEKAAREIPRAALVVSRDISETVNLHPVTKTLLSDRIVSAMLGFEG